MSIATRQAASLRLAELQGRVLELWQARAAPSRAAYDAAQALMPNLVRVLDEPGSVASFEEDIGARLLRGRTPTEALSAVDQLEQVILELAEEKETPVFAGRVAMQRFFAALRVAMVTQIEALQRELERAALRSEERYLGAARAAGFAIWDWDLSTQRLEWSSNVETLLGHSSGSLSTPGAWLEHVHPGDRERIGRSLRNAVEKGLGRWSEMFQFLRRDGTYASVLGRGWISHDIAGNAVRVIGGLIDVSEQRQLERQLEEQVSLTRTVAENATSCLFLLDRRGCTTYMNPAAIALTGYHPEEIRDLRFNDLMSPAHEHGSSLDECPVHQRQTAFRDHECTFVSKDGRHIAVACSLTPLSSSGAGGAVLELRDISELRRTQAALREAVRVRDDFLSIASHELRTPLSALRMHIQGLIKGPLFDSINERVKVRLQGAERSVMRMIQLVNELLDVSRLNADHLELELEDVELGEVLHEVIERMQPDIRRAGSALDLYAPVAVIGRWDRSRVDQIFSNLLSNAIKYGEGKPIAVRLEGHEERALLRVQDQGIGIAATEQARIFERFERAASQRHYGGFGLGLWIVRRVLDKMGGAIRVDSEPGKGATFEVTLPRRPSAGISPQAEPTVSSPMTEPGK